MENQSKSKRKATNWIGLVLFLLVIAGPQIIPPISRFVSQLTGGTINVGSNILPLIIIGLVLLTVIGSIGRAVTKMVGGNGPSAPKMPTPSSLSSARSLSSYASTRAPTIARATAPWTPTSLASVPGAPDPSSLRSSSFSSLMAAQHPGSAGASRPSWFDRWDDADDDDDDEPSLFGEGETLFPRSNTSYASGSPFSASSFSASSFSAPSFPGSSRLPGAPRFEPLVSGKVLGWSLLGAMLLGGGIALVSWIGRLPL
jgi:hypothetical protein